MDPAIDKALEEQRQKTQLEVAKILGRAPTTPMPEHIRAGFDQLVRKKKEQEESLLRKALSEAEVTAPWDRPASKPLEDLHKIANTFRTAGTQMGDSMNGVSEAFSQIFKAASKAVEQTEKATDAILAAGSWPHPENPKDWHFPWNRWWTVDESYPLEWEDLSIDEQRTVLHSRLDETFGVNGYPYIPAEEAASSLGEAIEKNIERIREFYKKQREARIKEEVEHRQKEEEMARLVQNRDMVTYYKQSVPSKVGKMPVSLEPGEKIVAGEWVEMVSGGAVRPARPGNMVYGRALEDGAKGDVIHVLMS